MREKMRGARLPSSGVEIRQIRFAKAQRDSERCIEFAQRGVFQKTHVVSQRGLWKAHQFVAMNARFLLETFRDADRNLSTKAVVS